MRAHEHTAVSHQSRSLLAFAGALTAATFAAELIGGLWTNSVALLSDAGHVLMDLLALTFSFLAIWLSERPASQRRTFGLHRLEVFAAFLNGALVTAVAVGIVVESVSRLRAPPEVKAGPMLAVAAAGLAVNLLVAWVLHGFAQRDINIRSAFLHVISDALASLGVVVGGLLIHWTRIYAIDPVVGILVALIIVVNAVRLLKDSIHILLEGVPKNLNLDEVVRGMKSVPGVDNVEDTHIWNICSHISSLSAHITLPPGRAADQQAILDAVSRLLKERFQIEHATLQAHFSSRTPADHELPRARPSL
jgi:cobalt-zinc-cadmium efflux system protein